MRTRRAALSPDHIGSLNLVEIEYADEPEVLLAWKNLFTHFGTEHPRRDGPSHDTIPHSNFSARLYQERQSLLAKLLHQMAKVLRFKIEQLEIFEGGYTPQFWADIESEQQIIRKYVVDLAQARTVVPMGVIDYRIHAQVLAAQQSPQTPDQP